MRRTGQGRNVGHGTPIKRISGRVLVPAVLVVAAMLLLVVDLGSASVPLGSYLHSQLQADVFIHRVIDGEAVSCLFGHVFVDRDTITARADTAYIYRERNLVEFVQNVRVTRNEAVLTCDYGLYARELGHGDFTGHVRVVEGDVIGTGERGEVRGAGRFLRLIGAALLVTSDYSVRADTIVQDRDQGTAEAFGHVSIMEPGAENLVTGTHALFLADGDIAEVDRHPVLVSQGQSGGPLRSQARAMRFFRNENRVVMIDSVQIRHAQTRAVADTAVAYGQDHMVLTGSPSITMGATNTMYGERMEFFYRAGELRRLIITGGARMEDTGPDSLASVYHGLPSLDVLEGDSIGVDFENGEIHRSVVVGNAHSRYTPLDVGQEVATNDVRGDTITLFFREHLVDQVLVQGQAEGVYRYARLAEMRAPIPSGSVVAGDSVPSATPDTTEDGLSFSAVAKDVNYGGQQVTFVLADRTMEIEGEGQLDYDTMNLTAGHIKLDTDHRELYADGDPVVKDGNTIAGEKMGYNFEHRSAAVADGVTSFENYYYVGKQIRRFDDQTMKIAGARMTSCDLAEPHYHFWTGHMKMRPGDKIVAAPVVLKVGHVPIFALPFYYKNLKSGRQSGILFPSFDFGWSSRKGRYIRDLGYYWATNEYMDFLVEGDYNENRDFGFRISQRYVKRYGFNGGIDYSRKTGLGGDQSREWQLRWNHNQPKLWDDYQFRADVRMASSTLSSNDFNGSAGRDIVSGQLRSNVYLSRSWSFGNANLSANRDERVNATDDDAATDNLIYNMTAPSLALNFKRISLAPQLRGGQHGSTMGNVLRSTYFQQGYTFTANRHGYENHQETSYAASGSWSLSYRPARLGIFNVSIAANARDNWNRDTSAGQLWHPDTTFVGGGFYADFNEVSDAAQPSLTLATGVGTTLYGMFPVRVGPLRAIRHTMRLNTSWSLRPGLGSKQVYSTGLGLNFDNRFDVKYLGSDSDSTVVEKKLDGVIDWSLSTSYNPQAQPGNQWSDISSGLTIKPGRSRYLKIKVSNTVDPVALALKRTAFTYGLSFAGRLDVGTVAQVKPAARNTTIDRLGIGVVDSSSAAARADSVAAERQDNESQFEGESGSFYDFYDRAGRSHGAGGKDLTEGGQFIPFDANASLSYAYTNATRTKRATVNLRFNTQLTTNWSLRYSASFDVATGVAVRQQYGLDRDLHCWRFEFNRTVSAVDSQFGFRLYLKAIPALKFARGREDYMSSPGGAFGGGLF